MRTIEWEAPALASLAAAHWLVAYERENSPRKRVRYENEIEFDGVAYMLMCEIELVEREHKAVSMMCGIEPQYADMPVRIIGNMGKAIGEILPVLNNFLDRYGVIYVGYKQRGDPKGVAWYKKDTFGVYDEGVPVGLKKKAEQTVQPFSFLSEK